MNKLDKEYQMLLEYILGNGVEKKDRTGTGTISVFGTQIRHDMSDGFPLLTTKRIPVKTMMTELKWFLKGDTNIKYLVDNGCNIWNGDAYKAFKSTFSPMPGIQSSLPTQEEFIEKIKTKPSFAAKWGELGPIYGKQWRLWKTNTVSIDQIQDLISELKTNPDSRRLMVSAWNVGELDQMTLPPCHYGFQVYTRELSNKERYDYWWKNNYETGMEYNESNIPNFDDDYYTKTPKRSISLMWNQRSVDTFLGLPFNIASYGMLLTLLAEEVGMIPDELIGNLGDTHLYSNHIEQAKEQINREPYQLPTIEIHMSDILNGEFDYELAYYQYHPTIKAPLSN
jgi:thymidylate synthase